MKARSSFAALLILVACRGDPGNEVVSRVWPAMGTMMSVAAWGGTSGADTARLEHALDQARDSIELVDSLFSGRGHTRRGRLRLAPGIALDSGAIAEGYALDRAALALAGAADSALLELGGQFSWVSTRPTRRIVGIADPENSLRSVAAVEMHGGSLSTVTELAPRSSRSVTVLAPSGVAADAWSTAFLPLGCDSTLALAPRLSSWRLSVVCADSAGVRWTPDLEGRVLLPRAPGTAGGRAGRVPVRAPAPDRARAGPGSTSR
jgi:thiamine biosynthesis lipoprotein ApbE